MIHAAFEFAEVLHARDHFLASVTTLGETHPADQLQVRHLWHECLDRVVEHVRQPGADVHQGPEIGSGRLCPGEGLRIQFGKPLRRAQYLESWAVAGDPDHAQSVAGDAALVGRRRERQQCRRTVAGEAETRQFVARVGQRHLGAQHEHLQALEDRVAALDRQLQVQVVTALQYPETAEHAALRAAIAAQLRRFGCDQVDVIGQLALQEGAHVGAGSADQSEVREIRDRAVGKCPCRRRVLRDELLPGVHV